MRTRLMRWLTPLAGLAVALAAAAPAEAVLVTCGTGSGIAGQTVDVAITTNSVTGFDIRSLQFELTYNANLVTATDVLESGTLVGTAGWGDATFGVTAQGTTGRIIVSHAGVNALAGAGTLLMLRFVINPAQLSGASTALAFQTLTFNEGAPLDTTANGSITINATPVITVAPNTGEVVRGQTLAFSVSGSVTNPVSWFTTDPGIATISGAGLLTGVAPGAVRVFAVDNAGRRDTTNGDVLIRGMGLTVGGATVVVGQPVTVPLTVTSLAGLGIRAGQVTLSFNGNVLAATGVVTPVGTLLHGWGPVGFGARTGECTVDFAGSTDLNGSGVLAYVTFATPGSGGTTVTPTTALFNETLPAKVTSGSITVQALPAISINPDNVTLLAGQTQQFTLGGSPTPPINWTTLDPAVAYISASGLLTAASGGVTKVRAVDAVGATDENTAVTVYDFALSLPTIRAEPGTKIQMYLSADRPIGSLNARSLQYRLDFHSTHIVAARAMPSGLVGAWAPGGIVDHFTPGQLLVAEAGTSPLASGSTAVQVLEFDLSPAVPVGTNLPITLSNVIFNEGKPSARITSGTIQVRTGVDAPDATRAEFALRPPAPNPSGGVTRLRFAIPEAAPVHLAVYALDGRRVRTLVAGTLPAGEHEAAWDGRDGAGAPAAAGLYFVRLEWRGFERSLKLARVR